MRITIALKHVEMALGAAGIDAERLGMHDLARDCVRKIFEAQRAASMEGARVEDLKEATDFAKQALKRCQEADTSPFMRMVAMG